MLPLFNNLAMGEVPLEPINIAICPEFLRCGSECCSAGTICTGGICVDTSLQCPNVASGTRCDDGNNCTEKDICYVGKCIGATCDDHNACTTDTCGPAGCVHTPVKCDDGNECTTNYCDNSTGCRFNYLVILDPNRCVIHSCDPATGYTATQKNCDDGNFDTRDSCDPNTGSCLHTPYPIKRPPDNQWIKVQPHHVGKVFLWNQALAPPVRIAFGYGINEVPVIIDGITKYRQKMSDSMSVYSGQMIAFDPGKLGVLNNSEGLRLYVDTQQLLPGMGVRETPFTKEDLTAFTKEYLTYDNTSTEVASYRMTNGPNLMSPPTLEFLGYNYILSGYI